MQQNFQYYAFISYKREDEKWARWLQRKLEHYRLPAIIRKEKSDLPKRIHPIFRDKTDLGTGILDDNLRKELEQSRFLIVICSPRSTKSAWVGKEIQTFVEMGRMDRIIPFIIDGTPNSQDPEIECFHPVIRNLDKELVGVNIHEAGDDSAYIKKQKAVVRVVAWMFELPFDNLWNRYRRHLIKQAVFWSVLVLAVLLSLGFVWKANQPFDVEVRLREVTAHNENLPFENGRIFIEYDSKIDSFPINDYHDVAVFADLPGKYKNKPAHLTFEMFGFDAVDSVLSLSEFVKLNIKRDATWGMYKGVVLDEWMQPIENAEITVEGFVTYSDVNGMFIIQIPILQQTNIKTMTVAKAGYKNWEYEIEPSKDDLKEIMLEQ